MLRVQLCGECRRRLLDRGELHVTCRVLYARVGRRVVRRLACWHAAQA